MRGKELVLQQVLDTTAGLYGLSSNGSVWVYQGNKHGWSKLNMKVMSARELKAKRSAYSTRKHEEEPF